MSFEDKLYRINELQATIDKQGKLSDEVLRKINYKFRLDWNYYSNSMEGNSLTMQETRSVMVGNITVEGKPLQDIWEMRKHDDLIATILKMGKGELNISERRIKAIHTAIMYEDNPEKSQLIGQWKTTPNYLYNYKNERFDFVEPADVPYRIHTLVNWINAEKDKGRSALHPVVLASQFHIDYVTIHPFNDGNGRTARILSNIILIAYGLPPVYVKDTERDAYYKYLADVQVGGPHDLFYEFMADLVIRSQEIVLNAVEGKDINESEDLDKRLHLIEKELNSLEDDGGDYFDKETFFSMYEKWIRDLVYRIIGMAQKFNHLFKGGAHRLEVGTSTLSSHISPTVMFYDAHPNTIVKDFTETAISNPRIFDVPPIHLSLMVDYANFIKGKADTRCIRSWQVRFERTKYEVWVDSKVVISGKPFHYLPTNNEIDRVVNSFGDSILDCIDEKTKELGLR